MSLPASLPLDADGDLYVFAYGSLIWRPGFAYAAMHPALLRGYPPPLLHLEPPATAARRSRRAWCSGSTAAAPAGASPSGCRAAEAAAVLDYLQEREMPPSEEAVYERRILRVSLLDSGREVRAVAFVADRTRDSYCRPEAAAAAATISRGSGRMGPNREYLLNTVAHLRAMGVRDSGLDRIAALLPPPA